MGLEGMGGLLLDGVGGVISEENLGMGGIGFSGQCGVWTVGIGRLLTSRLLCCCEGGAVV